MFEGRVGRNGWGGLAGRLSVEAGVGSRGAAVGSVGCGRDVGAAAGGHTAAGSGAVHTPRCVCVRP